MLEDGTVETRSTFDGVLTTAEEHVVRRSLADGGAAIRLVETLAVPGGSKLRWEGYYKRLENDTGTAGTMSPPCATQ